MEITEISISLREEEKLRAFVNITLNDEFVIRGMKIIKGPTGYFIAMPSRRMPDGSFKDIAHPITSEFRQKLEKAILTQYQLVLEDNKRTYKSQEAVY
ncbi:SpoVG family protein [candidate division KSB1 bacterium]|nr:SpoVG family protein [candidate division KSB1 bacterium]